MFVDDVMAPGSGLPSVALHCVYPLDSASLKAVSEWARVYSAYAAHIKRENSGDKLDQN
jgi:hypothetical protein